MVLGFISAGLSLAGGIEANRRSKKQAKNARLAGKINAEETRKEGRSVAGGILAAASSSGLSTASATNEALILESLSNAEFDAQMQVFQGNQRGSDLRAQGKAALREGITSAANTLQGQFQSAAKAGQ